MERIEVNVSTGERKVIPLTAAEILDAQKRTAAEQEKKALEVSQPTTSDLVAALKAKGILSDSDLSK